VTLLFQHTGLYTTVRSQQHTNCPKKQHLAQPLQLLTMACHSLTTAQQEIPQGLLRH
jgi:hypothetical protein